MLLKLYRRYLAEHRNALIFIVIFQLLQTASALMLPTLSADIIDNGVLQGDVGYIWRIGAWMLALSAVQIVATVLAVRLGARTAAEAGRSTRRDVFGHVQNFATPDISVFGAPSLVTRATNDVQQVQMLLNFLLSIVVMAPVMAIGGVIMAVRQDATLSLLLVVAVPLLAVVMVIGMIKLRPMFQVMQKKIDGVNRIMREQLTGVRVIRAFVQQREEHQRFMGVNTELRDVALKTGYVMAWLFPSVNVVIGISSVAVVWFGGLRIDSGDMQIGSLVAFLSYIMQIFMAVMLGSFILMMAPRGEVSAGRILQVLEHEPAIHNPKQTRPLPAKRLTFELADVSVRYPDAQRRVLGNIDLTLKPGTTTAVIGATGSGKSTLVNLFPRLMDITAGRISAGGISYADLDLAELRQRIALVPQKAYLFSGTVRSTLKLANPNASDEQLWEALRIAQADDFIAANDAGLDAEVDQGGYNFSGGQRQRLTIARALVRDADLYIFDDSFSALDTATEARLHTALRGAIGDAAQLIVAQRVSSVRTADAIVVLDEGHIVGYGTHDELIETCETYQEIASSQHAMEESA
ncbi:multidrug ABC transporter ATP-binding protein [Bowdeniella nasicola]|uniref:Multidrug ABC transporter ATP-binding protein n=1 Tax=Bowdeniella nasicola TaxID=208480 RepID=A0A1Q5Q5I1_9ACTO|nr:ABC transporter ATP-binding protein [Bowdeniella nasicola]OKL54880.1 multidrug ABC transporter ATP-binding protein [Bowdeniella nasicola]